MHKNTKVKDLSKQDFKKLEEAFKADVGSDLLECWGNRTVENMLKTFNKETDIILRRDKDKEVVSLVHKALKEISE